MLDGRNNTNVRLLSSAGSQGRVGRNRRGIKVHPQGGTAKTSKSELHRMFFH
ncbi:hypothetical protein SLEP1_g30180 [Rubroshorea leprosula]|uniref:Uncharacterized protein n=1 Tax=Rubroshorea leprosula TaxID=152421 RepID=A0AAV5K5J7_9ROSI|nr:hypothetical protein SLEP1_g30180 [Rubroshorea leprosula]